MKLLPLHLSIKLDCNMCFINLDISSCFHCISVTVHFLSTTVAENHENKMLVVM